MASPRKIRQWIVRKVKDALRILGWLATEAAPGFDGAAGAISSPMGVPVVPIVRALQCWNVSRSTVSRCA